jgi:hypothetical protein
MQFVLWLDPDMDEGEPPGNLLRWALDSIENTPDLVWDIKTDAGVMIAENVSRTDPSEHPPLSDEDIAEERLKAHDYERWANL